MPKYPTKRGTTKQTIPLRHIETETEHFVTIPNPGNKGYRTRKFAKRSEFEAWFDTFEEAKAWLVEKCQLQVELTQNRLDMNNLHLADALAITEALTDPDDEEDTDEERGNNPPAGANDTAQWPSLQPLKH